MPLSLSNKIKEYDVLLKEYNDNYRIAFEDEGVKENYNELVDKYNDSKYSQYKYNDDDEKVLTANSFSKINDDLTGYQQLISLYYDVVDMNLYLESSLMPIIKKEVKTAKEDIANLTESNLSPMAVEKLITNTTKSGNITVISSATVETSLKLFCKVYLYNNYKISITTKSWDYVGDLDVEKGTHYGIWEGTITLQSYKDEEDNATTEGLRIQITDAYADFLDQKLRKKLVSENDSIGGVYDVISIKYTEQDIQFKEAIKYYSLNRLTSFYDAYKGALDVLIEADQASPSADFYNEIYLPYYNRSLALENELDLRKHEIDKLTSLSDFIEGARITIQNTLNLKNYLGNDWNTFCSYRRESTYENQNYISTNYDNATLIKQANKFIKVAKMESVKAGTPQITVTISLKNIFLKEEFQGLLDKFKVGNWIRAKCDGVLYKLRLNSIQIDDNDFNKCGVEFTSMRQKNNCLSEVENTLKSAKSVIGSYSYTQTQMEDANSNANLVKSWFTNGLNSNAKLINDANTQNVVYDKNGLLVRSFDEITDAYEPTQLKVTNSTIAVTDDNWRTVKTAVGKFRYIDPETNEPKISYGINAETIVGQLLLGQNLKLYSESGYNKLSFDDNGLSILAKPINGKYSTNLFNISKQDENGNISKLLYVDESGNVLINSPNLTSKVEKTDYTGEKIASLINQTADTVQINAKHINLNGVVTANNNFKINTDGTVSAKNGEFTGKITSTSGTIGGMTITENSLKYIRKGKVSGFPQATLSVSYPAMAKDFTIMEWSLTADNKDADDVVGSLTPWTLTIGAVMADETVSAYSVKCDELYVAGKQITSSTTSDERLKTNISSLDNKVYEAYMSLFPKKYNYKKESLIENNGMSLGLIAQDVIKTFDSFNLNYENYDLVNKIKTDNIEQKKILGTDYYYAINYNSLHALHIFVNKQQEERIKTLEAEVNVLSQMINKEN